MERKRVRSVRSDKKVDCKPTVSVNLRECVYRLSYITNTPVKDVAERICLAGLNSGRVIEYVSSYFRRDYQQKNTFYIGDIERESLQKRKIKGPSDRITIRFKQYDYEIIRSLAYSLDVTPSKAAAILLEVTLHKTNFVNRYTKEYLKERLDEGRVKELRKIIHYINQNNPHDEKISWSAMLSFLYDEFKTSAVTINRNLSQWIDKNKMK